jgi:hypothetical protein
LTEIVAIDFFTVPTAEWTSLQLIPGLSLRVSAAVPDPRPRQLREYVTCCHGARTHLGLGKDTPKPRAVQSRGEGAVVCDPVLGGLHHRYWREAS